MIFDFLKLHSIPVSCFFLLASSVAHPIDHPCFVEFLPTIEVRQVSSIKRSSEPSLEITFVNGNFA